MATPHFGGTLDIESEIEPDLAVPWSDVARFREELGDLPDEALIRLARGGSADAFAVLFERYRHPALRLATYFSNAVDAKDIVAESFAQVYDQVRRGKGPQTSFRGYLFTSVRREAGRRAKSRKRVTPTEDIAAAVDRAGSFGQGAADGFERELVRTAFASLPERWRTVLWHLDVEGRKPSEVAPMMGLKPNSVSALAYRAREGLRRAYLEQHVSTLDPSLDAACQEVRHHLVAFVRNSAVKRDVTMIDAHLEECATCTGVHLELVELSSHLGAVSGALALGFAGTTATGYLNSLAAKAAVLVKTVAVAAGSTAAVVVTGMSVTHVPFVSPARAATVQVQPFVSEGQHEPDRSIGPAGDPTIQDDAAGTSGSSTSSATDDAVADQGQPGQGPTDQGQISTPAAPPTAPPAGQKPATVVVDKLKVSASVHAADVKASTSVDLGKLQDTRVTVKAGKHEIDTKVITDKVTGSVKDLVDKIDPD